MAAVSKRIKSSAQAWAVQSYEEAAATIRQIGELQREAMRIRAEMGDRVSAVASEYEAAFEPLETRIKSLQSGLQTWCEAHRHELCDGGKRKSHEFVSGVIQWRQRPPSVSIRGADAVMDCLERLGLSRFIRGRREPDKQAMLNEPDVVRGIAGITIVTGVEDFVVEPIEIEGV